MTYLLNLVNFFDSAKNLTKARKDISVILGNNEKNYKVIVNYESNWDSNI